MPEAHARLSPSAAERWFVCPGSVPLSEGIPSRTSEHAEEGTFAHGVAEQILKGEKPTCEPDMLRHVGVYVDHVNDLFANGDLRAIEKQVKASESVWGTADAIVWQEAQRTLHVVDLKYGAGVPVEVSNNLQLKIYALATLLTMKLPAQLVVGTIVQPRYNHPDGYIRSKEYDAVDLIEFHAELSQAVKLVELASLAKPTMRDASWQDAYLNPTEKGCRFCPAAPSCPKVKARAQQLAKAAFEPHQAYEPAKLSEALDFLPILEGWAKNVREFAYAEAEKGHVIPGYKLVEKRATRKWRDENEAGAVLTPILGDEAWKPVEVITPAAAEKLLSKDQKNILDQLTVKESSGHTLVHESDKREAIRVDAKAAFAAFAPTAGGPAAH